MIELEDMEYSEDNYNTIRYRGYLENSDLVVFTKYARYDYWKWAVYVPDDYPVQYYSCNYTGHKPETLEDCLEDFLNCYEPRTWISRAEQRDQYGPTYYRCGECGWEGDSDEIESVTVYEDYGDVSCWKCPNCGVVEYDGMEIFEEIG